MDRLGLRVRRFISMLRPASKAFVTRFLSLRVMPVKIHIKQRLCFHTDAESHAVFLKKRCRQIAVSYGFMVWLLMAERYCSFSFCAAYRNCVSVSVPHSFKASKADCWNS